MRALDLVRMKKLAQNVGDGVECHVFPTEVDVERDVAYGGMHMEGNMPARHERQQREHAALLSAADDLDGRQPYCAQCIRDLIAQGFFRAAPIAFTIIKIYGQQP